MPITPVTWEAEIRRIEVGGQPWPKLARPHPNKQVGQACWHMLVFPATLEA
jgi:hypothetical protein